MRGKTFIKGSNQVDKFNEAQKALLLYFSNKFDHRVQNAFEEKDLQVDLDLLREPSPPMKTDLSDPKKEVLDKDGVAWVKYQFGLKSYIELESKYRDNIQQDFNIMLSQYSPSIK